MEPVPVNCCANAVKFTPADSRINMKAAPVNRDGGDLGHGHGGIGIAAEDHEAVFWEL